MLRCIVRGIVCGLGLQVRGADRGVRSGRPAGLSHGQRAVVVLLSVIFAACGDSPAPTPDTFPVPAWAKVAPEQIAEAKKHGVPVAFENDLGMRFVLIPAGTFLMGSPEDEEGRRANETQHEVLISRPFYMSITEVTNRQYCAFDPDHRSHTWMSEHLDFEADGSHQPAVALSQESARRFAVWLGSEGRDAPRSYRLPTEAEWERACRAGTSGRFFHGGDLESLPRYANFSDAESLIGPMLGTLTDGHPATAPVGSYLPNVWGLYDMLGNVWEYCEDGWISGRADGDYDLSMTRDPVTPRQSRSCAVRGGSWNSRSTRGLPRCALRGGAPADGGSGFDVGFRLVSPLQE